jgi:two-component system, LytTR family, sensor kinase
VATILVPRRGSAHNLLTKRTFGKANHHFATTNEKDPKGFAPRTPPRRRSRGAHAPLRSGGRGRGAPANRDGWMMRHVQPRLFVNAAGRLVKKRSRFAASESEWGMSRRFAPRARNVAVVWLAWSAAGVFYITQDFILRLYRNEPVPAQEVVVGWMAAMSICAAFTPAILWAGRRWPLDQAGRWRHAAVHLALGAAFSVVSTAIEVPVLRALGIFPAGTHTMSLRSGIVVLLVYSFHGGVIRYCAVIGLQAVFRARTKAQAREREALELKIHSAQLAGQLTTARLSALKAQLQPHFLFNTLGAIMVLVQQQKTQQAEVMLGRLSDLLRVVVDDVDTQEVPLWRELEFLRLYLSIEQVRFHDRLRVRIAADPQVSEGLVPHMVLQPIVENAIRHGLGESEDQVAIEIKAVKSRDDLVLTVSDDGPGSRELGFNRKGVGLTNTRNRLLGLYGDAARLVVENRTPSGVRVVMTLPFRAAREEELACG